MDTKRRWLPGRGLLVAAVLLFLLASGAGVHPVGAMAAGSVAGAAPVPAGVGKILYAYTQCDDTSCKDSIWSADPDGSNQQEVTKPSTKPIIAARYSPDGSKIVATIDRSIVVMDANGENQRVLKAVSGQYASVSTGSWTSDGKEVLYLDVPDARYSKTTFHAIDVKGGTDRSIGDCPRCGPPEMSHDGKRIVFSKAKSDDGLAPYDIYVMKTSDKNPNKATLLTRPNDTAVRDAEPRWSPDDTVVATWFWSIVNSRYQWSHIRLIGTGGDGYHSSEIVISPPDFVEAPVAWSADGKQLAYDLRVDQGDPNGYGYGGVWKVNAVGSGDPASVGLPVHSTNQDGRVFYDKVSQLLDWQPIPARLRAVWFAEDEGVVQDRYHADPLSNARAFPRDLAARCPGDQNKLASYLDCDREPDGSPEWVWPWTAVRGRLLHIDKVRLHVAQNVLPPGATLKATIDVAGLPNGDKATLHLNHTITEKPDASSELTLGGKDGMHTDDALPNVVAPVTLDIHWQIEAGSVHIDTGHSVHPLYLLNAEPILPWVKGDRDGRRFITLVDLGTRAATGASDNDATLQAIWAKFESRRIRRIEFDPRSGGVVSEGALLKYWTPWSLRAFIEGTYHPSCRTFVQALSDTVGTCGAWAGILVSTLALQGIFTAQVKVKTEPGWRQLNFPPTAHWMMVKNWAWGSPGNRYSDYPFEVHDLIGSGFNTEEVRYVGVDVQGGTDPPPGLFTLGDHDIVKIADGGPYYDPSYGTGPYNSVVSWARDSLAGYATFVPISNTVEKDKCIPSGRPPGCSLYFHKGLP